MSKLSEQWIEVFRAGDYGSKGIYTAADVKQMADDYDPSKHEAPVVLGHPKDDAPAYAWVQALKSVDGTLFAKLNQIDPQFEESVDAGRYKKRSIALYRSKDGKLHLRHVGWLGAAVPEVKGLADAKFDAESQQFEAIDFQEEEMGTMAEEKKTFVEWFRELMGGAPQPSPQFSEQRLRELVAEESKKTEAKFSEELKTEREKREAVEKQFSEYKDQQNQASLSQRAKDAIATLKANKRWLPAYDKMGVPQLFSALSSAEIVEVEFGEGDNKQKKDALQLFADVLDGIGKIVPEGTLVEPGKSSPVKFSQEVDPDSVAFHEGVLTRMKEKHIPYNDAYKQLKQEGYKPVHTGTATAGAV